MKGKRAVLRISVLLILSTVLFLFLFPTPVSAESESIDELLSDFEKMLPEGKPDTEELIGGVGFDALLSELFAAFSENGGELAAFLLLLLGISLGFSLTEGFSLDSSDIHSCAISANSVVSASLIFSSLIPIVVSVSDALSKLSSFFGSLIPIASGIVAAGGALGSASVQAFNMNIALLIIGNVNAEILMPMVILMFSLSLVGASDSMGITASIAKGVRSFFFFVLGAVSAVLLASFSLQSILSSASDSAALRAARYAAGSSIPIVGSTVSAALSILFASASYAGANVGVGAIAVIVSMALSPLILLLSYKLALSIFISALEMLGSSGGTRLFSSFRSSIDALLAVYVTSVIICLFEIIVFIKCGVRTFG